MKGFSGAQMHTEQRGIQVSRILRKAVNQVLNEEQQKLKEAREAKAREPQKFRTPKTSIVLTDEEVLECRTLHEFHGWTLQALYRRYPQSSKSGVVNILRYMTRAQRHLDPRLVGPSSIK